MFTISISNEKCPCCSANLTDRIIELEEGRHLSDKKGDHMEPPSITFAEAPFVMGGNEAYEQPYAKWHCPQFQTIENNHVLRMPCPSCECEVIFVTGIISKFIRKPEPETEMDEDTSPLPAYQHQEPTPLTFLKWLKAQQERDDCVGDLARDFFATKHYIKTGDYRDNIPRDTNNYLAMREYFYSKREVVGDSFEMAWREFMVAREEQG